MFLVDLSAKMILKKMVKHNSIFIVILSTFLLISCRNNQPQIISKNFPETGWHRFDKLSFDMQIANVKNNYSISAIIKHSPDMEYDRIPLHIIMTYPSGEERIWEQIIKIRDKDGNLNGVLKDGVVDLEVVIRSKLAFNETGKIKLLVEQIIPKYDTPGIFSFALKLTSEKG